MLEWRRSYDTRPPCLEETDPRHPIHDKRYVLLDKSLLPATESLHDTINRVLPYWFETILPQILKGQKVVISAHGNSLRALVKHLGQLDNQQVIDLNIPTAIPLVYELDYKGNKLQSYYLID